MKKLIIGSMFLLSACGISKEAFTTEAARTGCEKANECLTEAEMTDFLLDCDEVVADAEAAAEDAPECTYDAKAAATCLKDLDAATCGDNGALDFPSSCADVCVATETEDTEAAE